MTYSFYITPEEYRIAEQNGIDKKRLETRIRHSGWHKERAITQPVKKQKDLKHWVKIAEQNGIPYKTFWERIHKLGWTYERATTTPVMSHSEIAAARNRKYPKEITDKAKANGIYKLFLHRMHCGWDLEAACSTPPMTKSQVGKLAKGSRFRGAAR